MIFFLSPRAALKLIEEPSVYQIDTDELYELDEESFDFLTRCASVHGCGSEGADEKFIDYCVAEKILTKDTVHLHRPPVKKSPEPSARYLELQITDRCNLRCRHCFLGDAEGRDLPAPAIRKVLAEFEEMQGLRLLITGGEPLLHPVFREINEMLPEFSLRKVLFSNGVALTGDLLDELNVEEVQLSIDGLEKSHDALRGRGSFIRAIRAVGEARDKGFDVSVSTMVHAKNVGDFDGMARLFRNLDIKEWNVDVPCGTGRLAESPDFLLSPGEAGRFLAYGYGDGLHSGKAGFGCGLHLMSILADGGVAKCTFYSDRTAGTIEEGLRECWKRIASVRLDDLRCDCEHIESCRGGCRFRAELLGDPKGKDLYRCAYYDIMGKVTRQA